MIIGIDLGTTNSLVAYFDGERSRIIPNRLGKPLTPSIVSIDENNNIMVGETAGEYGIIHPDNVAKVFKRTTGTEQKYKLANREYTAEDLSSFVLRALKEDAEAYLKEEVTEAVISVPAYFDDKRRKATKRAGELAGLKVERIISEPTAAAIAYGLYEKKESTRFLVFDLGGGTFDVSILELFDNILEVRAVAGDNYLGGEDFTRVIIEKFYEDNELKETELKEKQIVRIREAAEYAKKQFATESSVTVKAVINDEEKELVLTDSEYEKLCEPLLDKIRKPVQRSLSDAHIKLADINEVVLVGGATRLPIVQNFIVKMFHKFPDRTVNPDEAVAIGAAIQAAMKERKEAVKEVILTDVCSFTLGTEVSVERAQGNYEPGHFFPIIDRNTVIPASRTERLYTCHDEQDKIEVKVLQGESRFASNNLLLGSLVVDVPKNKAGKEAIDITYTYDINSLLEVEVKIISTGEVKKQIIKGKENNMTPEEIAKRMEELSYLKIQPRDQEENRLLLLKGERMYEECAGKYRGTIDMWLRNFEDVLSRQDRDEIAQARQELKDNLEELEEHMKWD